MNSQAHRDINDREANVSPSIQQHFRDDMCGTHPDCKRETAGAEAIATLSARSDAIWDAVCRIDSMLESVTTQEDQVGRDNTCAQRRQYPKLFEDIRECSDRVAMAIDRMNSIMDRLEL